VSTPLLLISNSVLRLLLGQSGESGQTELDLIKESIGKVEIPHILKGNQIMVTIPDKLWVMISKYPEIREISETADAKNFVIEGKVTPLLYDSRTSVLLDWKN